MASIFECLHPITTTACIIVAYPFGDSDLAADRLDFALLEPKNACCFLLEWSSRYSGDYFHSIWKQLLVSAPQHTDEEQHSRAAACRAIHRLTSSYEAFVLDSVAENLYRYANLRSFVVDLSRTAHTNSYPFLPNIDRWSAVIKAVLQQCSSTLTVFVINDHPFSFVPALSVHFKPSLAPTLLRLSQLQVLFVPMRFFYSCMPGDEQPAVEQRVAEWQGTLLQSGRTNGDRALLPSLRRVVLWNFYRSETNWSPTASSQSLKLPHVERVEHELRAGLPLRTEASVDKMRRLLRQTFTRADIIQTAKPRAVQRHYTEFDYHYSIEAVAAADADLPAVAVDVFCVSKIDESVVAADHDRGMRICRKPLSTNVALDLSAVPSMKGFDTVLPLIARKSPSQWKFCLKLNGSEPWSLAWKVLQHWQCSCGKAVQRNCACFYSQCKLDLYFTSRQSLSEVLLKWQAEYNSSSSGFAAAAPGRVNISRVKFRQLIDGVGKENRTEVFSLTNALNFDELTHATVSVYQQQLRNSMQSVMRDAVDARKRRKNDSGGWFRPCVAAAVYDKLSRMDFDIFRLSRDDFGAATTTPEEHWQNDLKHLAFDELLAAKIPAKPYFPLSLVEYMLSRTLLKPEIEPLPPSLALPRLRQISVLIRHE